MATADSTTSITRNRKSSTRATKPALDQATQEAIGLRLEELYHSSIAVHELANQLIADGVPRKDASQLWAIQELARGMARELEEFAERLQGQAIGYYANCFGGLTLAPEGGAE